MSKFLRLMNTMNKYSNQQRLLFGVQRNLTGFNGRVAIYNPNSFEAQVLENTMIRALIRRGVNVLAPPSHKPLYKDGHHPDPELMLTDAHFALFGEFHAHTTAQESQQGQLETHMLVYQCIGYGNILFMEGEVETKPNVQRFLLGRKNHKEHMEQETLRITREVLSALDASNMWSHLHID